MENRLLTPENTLLLLIDIQEKFVPILYNAQPFLQNVKTLIQLARGLELPILVSEQYPQGLGHTLESLRSLLPEKIHIVTKTAFGCLGESSIQKTLQGFQRKQILIAGLESHICVSQTVHQLLMEGYQPHLIQEAISARSQENYAIGIQKMIQGGAIPSCIEMALFELMKDSKHPHFKQLQMLVK